MFVMIYEHKKIHLPVTMYIRIICLTFTLLCKLYFITYLSKVYAWSNCLFIAVAH
jgi:hypothetical protein